MMVEEVAAYLATGGLGTVGSTILQGFYVDSDSTIIVLYPSGGSPPEVVNVSPRIESPELHIVVRASGDTAFSLAMEKMNDIQNYLHATGEITINSVRYLYFQALSSPFLVRYDYSNKPPSCFIAQDYRVVKEVES